LNDMSLAGLRGVEVGRLSRPVVRRHEAEVYYVDHCSAEELGKKYVGDHAFIDGIEEVDFIWANQPLVELIGAKAPLDFIVAAHVIEHVPDLCGWLKEMSDALDAAVNGHLPPESTCEGRHPTDRMTRGSFPEATISVSLPLRVIEATSCGEVRLSAANVLRMRPSASPQCHATDHHVARAVGRVQSQRANATRDREPQRLALSTRLDRLARGLRFREIAVGRPEQLCKGAGRGAQLHLENPELRRWRSSARAGHHDHQEENEEETCCDRKQLTRSSDHSGGAA
jgi:hypothetical protein